MSTPGRLRLLWAVALVLAAGGCSQLDLGMSARGLPWGEGRAEAEGTDEGRRLQRLAEVLAVWEREKPAVDREYRLGSGDVLSVHVFGLQKPDDATEMERMISGDGTISLPYAGELHAGGLTVRQLEQTVRAAYAGTYLRDPQVSVSVAQYRSACVTVVGAVVKPGVYPLVLGPSTVLESLAAAGGLNREAGDEIVLLRPGEPGREGKVTRIDAVELLDRGNLLLNLPVQAGDVVTVPLRTDHYVYVLGYVQRAGAYRIERGRTVDALRALALGGGLADLGRARNSYVVRQRETGEEVFAVNLAKVASGDLPPLYLQPGDVLVVGTSIWGKMTEILRPSMGASVSASANVVP